MANRKTKLGTDDPLWDHFINRPPADPKNDLAPVILDARGGATYPAKTEVDDPAEMSRNIKQLAKWWGADLIGITTLDSAQMNSPEVSDSSVVENPESDASSSSGSPYRFALVCALGADYDPATAKGLGGQVVMQNGAIVIHYLRSYLRELGYRAAIGGADPVEIAIKAGLGRRDSGGRFVSSLKRLHVQVFDPVLTDMPLAPDPLPK
ncbi:MAG: hypothetical protein ACE5Q6_15050 [Dehalococcoidia bacterium]